MNKAKYMTLFMHIVSAGSITKAADKLAVSKSVVSHQLKLLEQELGVTLLKRTTRKQHLTTAGAAFYQECCKLHEISESAWLDAKEAQDEPKGKLKIAAPHALMNNLIIPALGEALRDYPAVKLELVSSDSHQDLMQEDIDLTIRAGLSQTSNLKQKRIGSFKDILCQSRQRPLLKAANQEAIINTPYIANTWQGKDIQHRFYLLDKKKNLTLTFSKIHEANNLQSCIALIEAGFGIGIVPDFICAQHGDSLMPVDPNLILEETPIYALHPFSHVAPIAVKMAISGIKKSLSQQLP